MPNIHFYGVRGDLVDLLGLALELGCEVYEEYSAYDRELRRFSTVEDVVAARDLGHDPYGRGAETCSSSGRPR